MAAGACEYRKVGAGAGGPGPPLPLASPLLARLAPLLPALSWLPACSLTSLSGDLWAALLSSLDCLSSALCLSLLSGTPPHAALSSLAIHHGLWGLLSPHTSLRPSLSPLLCLLLARAAPSPPALLLLTLLSGLLQLLAALLPPAARLLLLPLPSAVTGGATAAAALLATSYSSGLLLGALPLSAPPAPLHSTWAAILSSHHRIAPLPATLGLSLLALLVILRRLPKFYWCEGPDPSSLPSRLLRGLKLSLSSARGALSLLLAASLALLWPGAGLLPLSPLLPHVPWQWASLLPALPALLSPALPLLPSLPLALHSPSPARDPPPHTRTFLLLGLGTLLSAPLGGLPLTTAPLHPPAASPLAHLLTMLLLLLCLPLLPLLLPLLPTTALGAVLLVRVAFDIEPGPVLALWRHDRPQLAVYLATLLFSLLSPGAGLALGALLSLLLLLHRAASAPLLQEGTLLTPSSLLTEEQGKRLTAALLTAPSPALEVDLSRVSRLDPGTARRLGQAAALLRERGGELGVVGAGPAVARILGDLAPDIELRDRQEAV